MRVLICGDIWEVTALDDEEFEQRFGTHAGVTFPETRCIVLNEDDLNRETVVHELCHAYFASTCVGAADLTPHQVEEVLCEMFAKHAAKILKQAAFIMKELGD